MVVTPNCMAVLFTTLSLWAKEDIFRIEGNSVELLKGPCKIQVYLIKMVVCPDNNGTNFMANFKTNNSDIQESRCNSGDTPPTLWRRLCDVTQSCLCDCQLPTNVTK